VVVVVVISRGGFEEVDLRWIMWLRPFGSVGGGVMFCVGISNLGRGCLEGRMKLR
jgi:hypothetical protein